MTLELNTFSPLMVKEIEAIISILEENNGKFHDTHFNGENTCVGYIVTTDGFVCPLFKGTHSLNPFFLTEKNGISLRQGSINIIEKKGEDWEGGFKELESRNPGFILSHKLF